MAAPAKHILIELAKTHGFDAVAFSAATLPQQTSDQLQDFLSRNYHGDMAWMETRYEVRKNPAHIWPDAKSVIVLGHNYGPRENPLERLKEKNTGIISVYAQGKDYHDVMKKKLKALARELQQKYGGEYKVFVDTAPVMEKPLAARSKLGWQGKHTCVVSREFGNWLFLGEIFTTLEIPPDAPEPDHCGACTRCLDICPTQAFDEARRLDARKCISYLTIEHKGHIAREFRAAMGNRIYGCDDCLAVCPWNKFAQTAKETAYHANEMLRAPALAELMQLDDKRFRQLFKGSPIKRTGRDRFVRNVMIAIGNSGNPDYIPLLKRRLKDPSPLVRAMAVWALAQLANEVDFLDFRNKLSPDEIDPYVQGEWNNEARHSPRFASAKL